jgi:hypothetical protein
LFINYIVDASMNLLLNYIVPVSAGIHVSTIVPDSAQRKYSIAGKDTHRC